MSEIDDILFSEVSVKKDVALLSSLDIEESLENLSVSISDTSAIFIGEKAHSKQKLKISQL